MYSLTFFIPQPPSCKHTHAQDFVHFCPFLSFPVTALERLHRDLLDGYRNVRPVLNWHHTVDVLMFFSLYQVKSLVRYNDSNHSTLYVLNISTLSWNPSLWKVRTRLFYLVSCMFVDYLASLWTDVGKICMGVVQRFDFHFPMITNNITQAIES